MDISGTRRLDALSWAGLIAGAVAVGGALLSGASGLWVVSVAALGALTAVLALRAPEPGSSDDRPVVGPEQLHVEVERARRLEYSFALVQLVRSGTAADPVDVARAEQRIRSTLRATDVLIDHGRELFLLLPTSETRDVGVVWQRLAEALPDDTAHWEQRAMAVFPEDGVTGDGLVEACRRGAGRPGAGAAANRRLPEVATLRIADEPSDAAVSEVVALAPVDGADIEEHSEASEAVG